MKLHVLGANGWKPSDEAQTACYAIPELGIILDAGSGLYHMADLLQTKDLDIYLSHVHGDHTWGLPYLELVIAKALLREARALTPEATVSSALETLAASGHEMRVHAAEPILPALQARYPGGLVRWMALQPTEPVPGAGKLTSFPVDHGRTPHTFGFRLDWPGRSLAYVTDCIADPAAPYVDIIRNVDVLLHECYMPDREADFARIIGHSNTTPVAQVAAKAGVGHLVFIHLDSMRAYEPELDVARRIFPATDVASDGMEIEF
jgi:ribonuclease Z